MATSKEKVEFIFNFLKKIGEVRYKPMFGEYGLYFEEIFIGVICDNTLFIKQTDISTKFLDESNFVPPYEGAKNYMKIPEDKLKDYAWLKDLLNETANSLRKLKSKK